MAAAVWTGTGGVLPSLVWQAAERAELYYNEGNPRPLSSLRRRRPGTGEHLIADSESFRYNSCENICEELAKIL